MESETMKIDVFKKDTIPHYSWQTTEIFRDSKGVVCHSRGPRTLEHHTRKTLFTFDSDVLEFYWFGKPFSLHVSFDRGKGKLHYYANIHNHPRIEEERISFVDYDLDVVRDDRAPAEIIDQDEFILHADLYGYTEEVRRMVPRAADFMKELINESPLFQKDMLKEAFSLVDAGERSFLSRWTTLAEQEA